MARSADVTPRPPLLERLRAHLPKRLERLGMLSPQETLDTYSAGARALLIEAELMAERGLHLARAVLWLVTLVLIFFVFEVVRTVPVWLVPLAFVMGAALWYGLWRLIDGATHRPWLKYALILADGVMIVRLAGIVVAPGVLPGAIGDVGMAPGDVAAAISPLLVYLALSGAFRLDPRPAAASTLVALVGYGITAVTLAIPTTQALAVGLVIWFCGGVGANFGRALRVVALRAREGQVLQRYVPSSLTRELARTGEVDYAGRLEEVTLLTADIRGFTRMSEHLSPADAVALLNDYFGVVVSPLAAEGAVLDGYVGDGLWAFFEGPNRASRALRAAAGMRAALDGFNAARPDREPLRIGIAIHVGKVLVGTIGAPERREYTIIGDAVNVTSRLEECNKTFESVLVASARVLADVGAAERAAFRGPETIGLRGHGAGLEVYYVPRAAEG